MTTPLVFMNEKRALGMKAQLRSKPAFIFNNFQAFSYVRFMNAILKSIVPTLPGWNISVSWSIGKTTQA